MLLISALILAASAHGVFGIVNVSLSIAEQTQHRGIKTSHERLKSKGIPHDGITHLFDADFKGLGDTKSHFSFSNLVLWLVLRLV
jgi:hypothetical protein